MPLAELSEIHLVGQHYLATDDADITLLVVTQIVALLSMRPLMIRPLGSRVAVHRRTHQIPW